MDRQTFLGKSYIRFFFFFSPTSLRHVKSEERLNDNASSSSNSSPGGGPAHGKLHIRMHTVVELYSDMVDIQQIFTSK